MSKLSVSSQPTVSFNPLPDADGSASYSHNGYAIVGTVNGPIEPQRRDELPEEAFLEVNVRPASGVGGPRDRHLEMLLHSTLRSLLLTHAYPRTLIQLTLQFLHTPASSSTSAPLPQSSSILPPLPALLHTAVLALVNANIGLRATAVGTCVAFGKRRDKSSTTLILDPSEEEAKRAQSLHVFAYDSTGDMVLAESEGVFNLDVWEEAEEAARLKCRGQGADAVGDVSMVDEAERPLEGWLRENIAQDLERGARWKGALIET